MNIWESRHSRNSAYVPFFLFPLCPLRDTIHTYIYLEIAETSQCPRWCASACLVHVNAALHFGSLYFTNRVMAGSLATALEFLSLREERDDIDDDFEDRMRRRRSNSLLSFSLALVKLFNRIPRPRRATLRRLGNNAVKEAIQRYELQQYPPPPRDDVNDDDVPCAAPCFA